MKNHSYERINYALRPAKSIERKMICQSLNRLCVFGSVESYRYIGFGSTYFSDFILFHKLLGINNMLSIERSEENKDRFEFNKPFKCIQIAYGESNSVLPELPWDLRTILWLDYDGGLDGNVLADIGLFCTSACPGSVIILSLNAHPDSCPPNISPDEVGNYRLERLIKDVGKEKVPAEILAKDLAGWAKAKVLWRIITNQITETLSIRNGMREPGTRIKFQQLFHFHYQDGAKMLTVGGILYEEGQSHILAACGLPNFPFVKTAEQPYSIEVPNLTLREIRHLDSQLPVDDVSILDRKSVV